jgi:hypothetical protein
MGDLTPLAPMTLKLPCALVEAGPSWRGLLGLSLDIAAGCRSARDSPRGIGGKCGKGGKGGRPEVGFRRARFLHFFGVTGSSRAHAQVGNPELSCANQTLATRWRHLTFKGYQREKSQKIAL